MKNKSNVFINADDLYQGKTAKIRNCHSEPVRTMAWESPGFLEIISSIREIATPVTSVTGSQ